MNRLKIEHTNHLCQRNNSLGAIWPTGSAIKNRTERVSQSNSSAKKESQSTAFQGNQGFVNFEEG